MERIFNFYRQITASLVLMLCVLACARQGAPTGGPKDITAPKLDTMASSPNFTTRFDQKRIELRFDEWITLDDASNQVIISPPLSKRPKITLKGKMVLVELPEEEVLRSNTTYTINFGKSVKDLHEGNIANDLRFVFSTGDFIDSLSIGGLLVDAYSGLPVENMTVMLYDSLSDSIVRKERPYYFSRTDKTGQFTMDNLKSGQYKMVAIDDTDQNLKWSGESERIAYIDTLITVSDSMHGPIQMRLFKANAPFRLFDRNVSRYGLIKLVYISEPDSVQLRTDPPDIPLWTEKVLDTLLVWYDRPDSTAWQLLANADTVSVKALSRNDFLNKNKILLADDIIAAPAKPSTVRRGQAPPPPVAAATPTKTIVQSQSKKAEWLWKNPIASFDTSKWMIMLDSTRFHAFSVAPDSVITRKLLLSVRWQAGKSYDLMWLPGAVTDIYGTSNTDTLRRLLSVPTDKQLGGLNLQVEALTPEKNYVLQLLNGTTVEEERRFKANTAGTKITYTGLPTATYTVVLIEDDDNNGKWDTGNYFAHRQPERIFSKKLEALRANWVVEATITTVATSGEKKRGQ